MKPPALAGDSELRFAAENTLGGLARWLRLLGFDTLYLARPDPGGFLRLGEGGRLLLTRTRRVAARLPAGRGLLIEPEAPREQVRQVIRQLGIGRARVRLFSRCLRCNTRIVPLARGEALGRVPDYVWQTQSSFSTCPDCGRIYWSGTHLRHAQEILEAFFAP